MKRAARAWMFVLAVHFAVVPALGARMAARPGFDRSLESDGSAPTFTARLDTRFGVTRSVYSAEAFPQISGYALLLLARIDVQVSTSWTLVGRAPLVLARVEQPAGALYGEAAWGNPQIGLGSSVPLMLRDGLQLTSSAALAVGVPLAEHQTRESQLEGRSLAIADALEGFSAPELYTPGVVPVSLGAGLRLGRHRWQADGSLGLIALLRVSDAHLTPPSRAQGVGLVSVVGVSLAAWPLSWLGVSLNPRLALRCVPPAEQPSSRVQLLLPAEIRLRVASSSLLTLSLQAPVAGALGGTTVAGGLGIATSF